MSSTPYPVPAESSLERSIPEHFAAAARLHAGRVAVRSEGRSVSYAELARHASRIAAAVRAHTAPGDPVVVLLENGAAAIAAMLGVLEAGCVWIPADPTAPIARARPVVEESGARLLVTDDRGARAAGELAAGGISVLRIDEQEETGPAGPAGPPAAPDAAALVLYTSGSTGRPKGVLHDHRGVLARALEHADFLGISPRDRVALLYSLAVAGALRHVFSALLRGATLCPFDLAGRGFDELARWLDREAITVFGSAATVFRHLAGALEKGPAPAALRVVHVGSETVRRSDVELHRQRFPERSIFVAVLGSSEVSPVCRWVDDRGAALPDGPLPVGRPAAGTSVLLLDDDGREVAAGSPGEIVAGGRALFRGYWRRPDLDAAAFLSGPGGERLFRTGDRALLRPDGQLVHLGRKDSQVKIRGRRVELEAVEAAVLAVPGVLEVAVTTAPGPGGDPRIVAHFVAARPVTAAELRRALRPALAESAMPASFVPLRELPRTGAGKIDRAALAEAGGEIRPCAVAKAPASTATEARLASLWAEVLESDVLGVDDDFLEAGGHSLHALRLTSRILDVFAVEIEPRAVFDHPTIARLAAEIDALRPRGGRCDDPSIPPEGREEGYL